MARLLFLYAGMVVLAAFAARWGDCPSLFRLPPDALRLWGSLGLGAAIAAGVVWGGRLFEGAPWYRRMARVLKRMLQVLLGPRLDGQKAFVIAIYSSIGEEALFRGFLQPFLIDWLRGVLEAPDGDLPVVLGVVLAGLIFGLVHFPAERELRPWTVFAVLVGILFGALAAWSGSLIGPILAHHLINWLNLKRLAEIPLADD